MSTRLSELDSETQTLREREHLTEIGELARGLAHSLRNPLNVLGLAVEELVAHADTSGDQLARSARAQISRIDQTLRSFLALASGDAGNVQPVAMEDVARDVALELMQDVHLPTRVRVIADEQQPELNGVEAELRAVLHTLVVNAVEASPPDGVVTVEIKAAAAGVAIHVCDDGPGLAPEIRERLFTPHLTTKERGAGMGLFLAERIVKNRYGGQLELLDRDPRGTCAVLTLSGRKGEAHA
jgi:signal transduction histidine kinase